jgi:hypothetical protein
MEDMQIAHRWAGMFLLSKEWLRRCLEAHNTLRSLCFVLMLSHFQCNSSPHRTARLEKGCYLRDNNNLASKERSQHCLNRR